MKEVFTTAYPKSGSTWLNNLLGDMLKCRVTDVNNNEAQNFGESEFQVIKLHMPWDEGLGGYQCYTDDIRERCKKGTLIFIQRDPRAVIVSAMHYRKSADTWGAINHMCSEYEDSGFTRYEMWVNSYLKTDKADLCVKYEDLHDKPREVLRKIADLLNYQISNVELDVIIENQSFKNYKDDHFYWRGEKETWKEFLTSKHLDYIKSKLGNFMKENGYE